MYFLRVGLMSLNSSFEPFFFSPVHPGHLAPVAPHTLHLHRGQPGDVAQSAGGQPEGPRILGEEHRRLPSQHQTDRLL